MPETEIRNVYPDISEIIELQAHYDEHHPLYKICEYLIQLSVACEIVLPAAETNDNDEP